MAIMMIMIRTMMIIIIILRYIHICTSSVCNSRHAFDVLLIQSRITSTLTTKQSLFVHTAVLHYNHILASISVFIFVHYKAVRVQEYMKCICFKIKL